MMLGWFAPTVRRRAFYGNRQIIYRSLFSTAKESIAGTAPYYKAHLVIHDPNYTSRDWPRKIDSLPLMKSVSNKFMQHTEVNISLATPFKNAIHLPHVHASLYDQTGKWEFPFSIENTASAMQDLERFYTDRHQAQKCTTSSVDVFVCAHAQRDCRCGQLGSEFFDRLQCERDKWTALGKEINVAEISHVGKHALAANVLTYPSGNWYGSLSPEDCPRFYRAVLFPTATQPVWLSKWRGQMGLSQEGQVERANKLAKTSVEMIKSNPYRKSALGDQVTLTFRRYDGTIEQGKGCASFTIEGDYFPIQSCHSFEGETVKDVAKRLDLVEAICGGIQECATCAIDIETQDPLPPISAEEDEQLDFAIDRRTNTRLGCCLPLTTASAQWKLQLPRY